jgi:hypothetical protein
MPDSASSTLLILFISTVGLLVLLAGILLGISRRLCRMERMLGEEYGPRQEDPGPLAAETSAGGAFETFLSEDPSRRNLPKGEQFAAYRRWRQENGLNWSNG